MGTMELKYGHLINTQAHAVAAPPHHFRPVTSGALFPNPTLSLPGALFPTDFA